MARIAGVNIPTNKRVEVALTYIHGIGDTFAKQICEKVAIPPERRVSQDELVKLLRAKQKEKPDQPVVIAASKDLPYGDVVAIMDLLQRNQVTKVGLLAKPNP